MVMPAASYHKPNGRNRTFAAGTPPLHGMAGAQRVCAVRVHQRPISVAQVVYGTPAGCTDDLRRHDPEPCSSFHVCRQGLYRGRRSISQFNVSCIAPEGTSLQHRPQEAEAISAIRKLPGVQITLTTAGGGADKAVNSASIYVKLVDVSKRASQTGDATDSLSCSAFSFNLHTSVELVATVSGGASNAQVQYFIQGPDLAKLTEYSEDTRWPE